MEATDDEFAFAWVGVDIPHSKNTSHTGGKVFRVDLDLFFLHVQAPVGNGAQLRRQTLQNPQLVIGNVFCVFIGARQ